MGVGAAMKKFGKGAVKKAMDAEKKVSGKADSKKELEELSSKMKPTDKRVKGVKAKSKSATTRRRNQNVKANQAATDSAKTANIKSGRKRIGAATSVASTAPMFMGSDDKKITSLAKESTGNFKAQDKDTVPTGVNLRKEAKSAAKMDNRQGVKSATMKQKSEQTKTATDVSKPPTKTKSDQSPTSKRSWKDFTGRGAAVRAKKAGFDAYMGADGKKKAAVLKEDLGKKETLGQFLNTKARGGPDKPKPKIKKMNMGGMTNDPSVAAMMPRKKRKPMTPAQRAMGGGAAMPMMNKGGKVRGAGMAKKGVRACKMR